MKFNLSKLLIFFIYILIDKQKFNLLFIFMNINYIIIFLQRNFFYLIDNSSFTYSQKIDT